MTTDKHLNETIGEIESAELLLPWYVAGTLSPAEMAEVEAWLESDPAAKAHLARVQEEHQLAIEAAEEIPMPRASAINQVLEAIGADAKSPVNAPSLSERLMGFLTPRWVMTGAAALALLMVAQNATIGILNPGTAPEFQTASGASATIEGVSALVAFQPTQSLADISAYLEENGLRIVDGPKPGGIYRIAAEDSEEGKAALEALGDDKNRVSFYSGPSQ
jgi:anti-sigma factor RsiW